AYGVEVESRIHAVEAFEPASGSVLRFTREDCAFAYRDSRFKHAPDRWIVTAVEFAMSRTPMPCLDYAGVRDALAANDIHTPSPLQVADTVAAIRRPKLPDPARIGNAG